MSARTRFRELLAGDEIVIQPVVFDALSALLARRHGFRALGLGGYQMGSHLGVSEPLLGLEDVAALTRYITAAVPDTPLMVDAGAGWGEPLHVRHTVRALEAAGATSIHIEDQIYPKRAHYHKGVEHVVGVDAMLQKIDAALSARRDPELAIVVRTDAMRTDDYEEGVRRARRFADAGADLLMLFPNDDDEARRLPRDVPGVPLAYVNSAGNRLDRPMYGADELEGMGYRVAIYAIATSIVAAAAVDDVLGGLAAERGLGADGDELRRGRALIEEVLGLDGHYAVERATVEQVR
jgi:methylisocitrate lyase